MNGYTYADGNCEVDDCKDKKFPSSATSKAHDPMFNILHQKMILKEATHSFWGASFDVYDLQGNTNDIYGSPKGKWWRKWGPWYTLYYYEESSGSFAQLLYMRKSVNPFAAGQTHIIGRCDEQYPAYVYTEGPHWFSNLFTGFRSSDKGWQFDITQDGKMVGTAVESKDAKNMKFYSDESANEQFQIGSASQHKEGADNGVEVKGEWNVDNVWDKTTLPYYVPNAVTLLLAFSAYNKEQAEAKKQEKEAAKAAKSEKHQ